MKTWKRTLVLAAFLAAHPADADEAQGSRLYGEYMARRQGYERRVSEAREEFAAFPSVTWTHVVTKRPPPIHRGAVYRRQGGPL